MLMLKSLASLLGVAAFGWADPGSHVPGAVLVAQGDSAREIVRAAVVAVIPRLPAGALKLDVSTRPTSPLDSEELRTLARALGIGTTTLDRAHICESRGPSTCRLEATTGLIRVDRIAAQGDGVSVRVQVWYETDSTRQPVASEILAVSLTRREGRWEATGVELIAIT